MPGSLIHIDMGNTQLSKWLLTVKIDDLFPYCIKFIKKALRALKSLIKKALKALKALSKVVDVKHHRWLYGGKMPQVSIDFLQKKKKMNCFYRTP